MRYGSVCSGIEGASCAWDRLGWTPVFLSEIDKHASAVLSYRYPMVRNLGDMTKIENTKENEIDLLVGGTPCQAFSVAGLRRGIDDERGNLTLEFVRLLDRLRPRWFIWENVPGIFSVDGGRTFPNVLEAFRKCGYSCGYRVLDASAFGLAQARKRVFIVGHIRDWKRAAAVLFDTESLRGHPAAIQDQRQAHTRVAQGRFIGTDIENGERFEYNINDRVAPTLTSIGARWPDSPGLLVGKKVKASTYWNGSQRSDVLTASGLSKQQAQPESNNFAAIIEEGLLPAIKEQPLNFRISYVRNGRSAPTDSGVVGAPTRAGGATSDTRPVISTGMAVRRLTPIETERLQGYPDDHTLYGLYNGKVKTVSDTQRYKMIGNAFPVPVVRWLGERIKNLEGRWGI